MLIRFPGRNDPNDRVIFSVTMADHQNAEFETHAKHNESVFVLRMVRIEETNGILVKKDCLRFLERNAVFPYVFPVLVFIPFKA
jgi:hypothetical protein